MCRLCTLTCFCECLYFSLCARFLCACASLALLTTLQRNEVISCRRPTQPLLRDGRGVKGRWEVCLVATINLLSVLSCHHRLCFALSAPSTQMCAFVEPVCVHSAVFLSAHAFSSSFPTELIRGIRNSEQVTNKLARQYYNFYLVLELGIRHEFSLCLVSGLSFKISF